MNLVRRENTFEEKRNRTKEKLASSILNLRKILLFCIVHLAHRKIKNQGLPIKESS
jgi:hypothetical protein